MWTSWVALVITDVQLHIKNVLHTVSTLYHAVLDLNKSRKLAHVKAAVPRRKHYETKICPQIVSWCYATLHYRDVVFGRMLNTPCSPFSTCCIPPTTMRLLVGLLAVYVGGFDAVLRCQADMVLLSIHSPQPTQSSLLSAGWMTLQLATMYSCNYMYSWGHLFCHIHLWQNSQSVELQAGDGPPVKSYKTYISTGKIKQGTGSVTWNFVLLRLT